MSAVLTAPITEEEYFRLPPPATGTQELVRGEVISMPSPGLRHGEIQVNVSFVLKLFLRENPIGRVAVESGVITERDPDTVRGPDVSYYSQERLPLGQEVLTYHIMPPDLCVEIASPSDTMAGLLEKAREYLMADVRMVWVIDPEDRSVSVMTVPTERRVLTPGAILDGGDVLPGFQCPVSELFR